MFGVGGGEVLVILLVALVVLGPDKLPGAVRKAGQVMGEIRQVSQGFQSEMRNAMYDVDDRRRDVAAPPPVSEPADPRTGGPAGSGYPSAGAAGSPELAAGEEADESWGWEGNDDRRGPGRGPGSPS